MSNFERWCCYTSDLESPDIYIKWGFSALIASSLNRRVWLYPEHGTGMSCSSSIFPNLYLPLIGPPATGKGRVIKAVASVLKDKRLTIPLKNGELKQCVNVSPDKVTCEKLIDIIAYGIDTTEFMVKTPEGKLEKRTEGHSSCAFLIEELEVLYSSNSSDMVNLLNQCFDSGDLRYETKKSGSQNIKNICVSMLSGTTPEAIRNLLTERIISNGHTSRMIFVYAEKPRKQVIPSPQTEPQREAFLELVKHCKTLASKVGGPVTLSKDAEDYFRDIYEAPDGNSKMLLGRLNKDPRLDHYYGRKKVHWMKLAIIDHFGDNVSNMEIQLPSMQRAYIQLNETELNMHLAFKNAGKNDLHESTQQIERCIDEMGEVGHKKLWFKFSNDVKRSELDLILETLLGTDRIENTNKNTAIIDRGIFKIKNNHKNGEHHVNGTITTNT